MFSALQSDSNKSVRFSVQSRVKLYLEQNRHNLEARNAEIGARMVAILYSFDYLEVSDTKKDLRNEFFVEFWSYDNKGLSIRAFIEMMSKFAEAADRNGPRI